MNICVCTFIWPHLSLFIHFTVFHYHFLFISSNIHRKRV
uniref:Uncharacterized protein n=1 Tax=Rhizophora mucronata TaxID=61149 RepID=A0A2P2NCI6_RHIMU